MIELGRRIEFHDRRSVASLVCLTIGLLLLITAFVIDNGHPLLAAIFFLAIGIALWRQPSRQDVVLDDNGIDFQNLGCKLPYDQITWLSMGDRFVTEHATEMPLGPIQIGFESGRYLLAEPVGGSAREFVQFVRNRMSPSKEREVNLALADFYHKESKKFGKEKVNVIHARKLVPEKTQRNRHVRVGVTLIAAGLVSLGAAAVVLNPTDELSGFWFAGSLISTIVGIVLCITGSNGGRRKKNQATLRDACIVISPSGLAMVQGSLRGALRWDEIVKVANGPGGSFGNRDGALHLSVAGGSIIVLDLYEVPLTGIASLIRKNLGVGV